MNKYKVISGPARFFDGVLELSKEQAATRIHNLQNLSNGLYRIMNQVEFKAGEMIGYDGQPSKALLEVLEIKQPLEAKPLKTVKDI